MVSSADTPRARQLGAELRQARENAKLSQRALAERVGRNSSHIARWENGKLIPSQADTAAVAQALAVDSATRDRLVELARNASDPDWLAPGIDRQVAALLEYERTATTITTAEPLLMPGLMQTYDYAYQLAIGSGATRGEATQRAQMRVGRQHVLRSSTPPRFEAFVGEYAVRHSLCSDEVMVEQLKHLLKLAALDSVTVRLLRMDEPVASVLSGPWSLLEFEKTKPIVHLEHYGMSATITESKSVARYKSTVATMREMAMSPEDSTGLIADVIENKETTQ